MANNRPCGNAQWDLMFVARAYRTFSYFHPVYYLFFCWLYIWGIPINISFVLLSAPIQDEMHTKHKNTKIEIWFFFSSGIINNFVARCSCGYVVLSCIGKIFVMAEAQWQYTCHTHMVYQSIILRIWGELTKLLCLLLLLLSFSWCTILFMELYIWLM